MNDSKGTIFKNASALMLSQIITWALTLALMVFLPRYLGATAVGQLTFAQSIWAIAGVLIAFGMDTYLMKEIARYPEKTPELIGASMVTRGFFCILGFGAVALYMYLLDYPTITTHIVYIIGVSVLIGQFTQTFQSALYGLERMEFASLSLIGGKLVNTVLGITILLMGYGVYIVAGVIVIAAFTEMILQLYFLNRRYRLHLRFRLQESLDMLKSGAPYLMSILVVTVYFQVDILLLSILVNETEIGLYSVALRLTSAFMFLPVILTTAIFPAIARSYANVPEASLRVMRRSFDLMLLLGVPIGMGLFAISDRAVILLFGEEFAPSGLIVAFMAISLIFTYLSTMFGRFVIATDRVNQWTLVIFVATVATIPMDIYLIPWCQRIFGIGALAGAISYLITEFGMVSAGILLLPRGTFAWSNVRTVLLSAGSGTAMVGVCWWSEAMPLAITIGLGAITYTGLIFLTRAIPSTEIALFTDLVRQGLARFRRTEAESPGITGV